MNSHYRRLIARPGFDCLIGERNRSSIPMMKAPAQLMATGASFVLS